ncbi:MAG TPA: biopolymer transporter ExbD [Candidatus Acidoferrales bacterium]|nr:biopolymer transporter ExbD [Candidatus Acidoferrales bacterium]
MGYKPKAPDVMAAPNVIPMADIMLVLLIIFMVITPMLQKGVSVDMAKVPNPQDLPDADKDDAVIIAVTREGNLYISMGSVTNKVSLDEISGKVRDLISNRLDKTVYVRADARAKFGAVKNAVDEVRAAGVDNVGLLTQKIQQQSTAAPPPPTGGSD